MTALKQRFRIIPESDENPRDVKETGVLIRENINCIFATEFPRKIFVGAFEGIAHVPRHCWSIQ